MADRLRLLFVTPTFYPAVYWGGPIFSVFGLCNALANRPEIELRVLTTDAAGPRVSDRLAIAAVPSRYGAGYDVYFTRRRFSISGSPGLLIRLWRMVRWADVVHLTGTYSFPVIPTLVLCRLFSKTLIWSPRGALQRWTGSSRRWAKRQWERICNALLLKGRTVLHVTSEQEGRESGPRIPRAEIVLVPNGVELPELPHARDWKPQGILRLLYMGRLDPKKGIENLLEALNHLAGDSVELSICGRGLPAYEAALRNVTQRLELGALVRFRGLVEGDTKARSFFQSDICVVPSYTENFGMVVAEALAHGVPVIASRGTPWSELETRGCGRWVDNSPESLAYTVSKMRRADLKEMGLRGRKWMEEDFAWPWIALCMEKVYRRFS